MPRFLSFYFCAFIIIPFAPVCAEVLPMPAAPAPILPVEETSRRVLAPGVELTTIRRNSLEKPLQIFITRVDPKAGGKNLKWKLKVATGGESVFSFAPVSQIAKRDNAMVAINGGYFAFGGAALGALKIDGEWMRLPMKNRTALGIDERGRVLIDSLQAEARVAVKEDGNRNTHLLPIENLNGYAPPNGLGVVTARMANVFWPPRPHELRRDVVGGFMEGTLHTWLDTPRRDPNNWAIVGKGEKSELLNRIGAIGKASFQISTPAPWNKYQTILGAGPRLLQNGEIFITDKAEEFRPDVIARGPRSAFGVDKNGHWIFFVCDGRAPEYSVGLTLPELALEMKNAGAVDALCLDGGGSSTLAINGAVINRFSDKVERKVPNAIIVVPQAP